MKPFQQTFVGVGRFDADLLTRARRTQPDRGAADYATVIAAAKRSFTLAERFIPTVHELVGD